MRSQSLGWIVAVVLAAGPAVAQTSLADSFTLRGRAVLDFHQTPLTPVTSHGLVDLDLIVEPGAGVLPDGMGLEIGLYHYADDAIPHRATAGFAALTFDLGQGRLAVGAPRDATHGLRRAPLPGGAEGSLHPLHSVLGGVPTSAFLYANTGEPFWGLRYDRVSGPLTWSVSALHAGGMLGTTDFAFGVSGEFASLHLYAGGEAFRDGVGWGSTLLLGGELPIQGSGWMHSLTLGAEYARTAASGLAFESLIGYGRLALNDRLSITASALYMASPVAAKATIIGLSADYEVWNGIRLNVGAHRNSSAPITLYSFGLSRRF